MPSDTPVSRRRALRLTGAAAATALVAGCGGPGTDEDPGGDQQPDSEGGGEPDESEPLEEDEDIPDNDSENDG